MCESRIIIITKKKVNEKTENVKNINKQKLFSNKNAKNLQKQQLRSES